MNIIPEIEIRLSSKGTYYWSIKIYPKANSLGAMPEMEDIASDIKAIDAKLKEIFPTNVTAEMVGRAKVEVKDIFDEAED